jgi:hypothetical protein
MRLVKEWMYIWRVGLCNRFMYDVASTRAGIVFTGICCSRSLSSG